MEDWQLSDVKVQVMLGLVLLLVFVWLWGLLKACHYRQEVSRRGRVEDEEKRMFSFLRGLGHAVEDDLSAGRLNQVIVKGVVEVLKASGSALYLLDERGQALIPAVVTKEMPSLIGLSEEELAKVREDKRFLHSHLCLSSVGVDSGLMGKTLKHGKPLRVADAFADVSLAGQQGGNPGRVAALLAPLSHGGAVIGLLVAAKHEGAGGFSDNDFEVFVSISEQTAFAIGHAMAHSEAAAKRHLDRELRAASEVQRILLPARPPVLGGFRLAGRNLPARVISGDYLDYIPLGEGRLAVVIADVSGKGVPAGLLMAMCRAVLRSLAPSCEHPAELLRQLNRHLFPDIREDMFISLAMVVLEENSSKVSMVRAGHDAPLFYRRQYDQIKILRPRGLALGIDDGDVFDRAVEEFEFEMHQGDCLLLYTDGIPEAVDAGGFEFGAEELQDSFRQGAVDGAEAALDHIVQQVKDFVDQQAQADDLTLITIEKR